MKLLMHTCCAPCSVYCIDSLRKENIEPTLYWYNPNIHPYTEYKARRDCLKEYSASIGINTIFEEDYGLKSFCENTIQDLNNRCSNYCYKVRLTQTAKFAKEHGFDAITTTLLVSPYQNHEVLKQLGKEIANNYGLDFLYRDFRIGFREGQAKARELGLYMKKYCGCIFSEEDRYSKQIMKDKLNDTKLEVERSPYNKEILEKCLPVYLENDLKNLKEGIKNNVSYLDCLINELQGSVNSAFVDGDISEKQCDYLYEKYIRMEI